MFSCRCTRSSEKCKSQGLIPPKPSASRLTRAEGPCSNNMMQHGSKLLSAADPSSIATLRHAAGNALYNNLLWSQVRCVLINVWEFVCSEDSFMSPDALFFLNTPSRTVALTSVHKPKQHYRRYFVLSV